MDDFTKEENVTAYNFENFWRDHEELNKKDPDISFWYKNCDDTIKLTKYVKENNNKKEIAMAVFSEAEIFQELVKETIK